MKKKFSLPKPLWPWVLCLVLAFLAAVLKFVLPGYGFSALVCLGLIALIVFYDLTARLRRRWPKAMKWLRRIFTIVLCLGLAVALVTEAVIIHASFGDPKASCDYIVVLGAKVRHDGPSLSLWDRITAAADYLHAHPDVIAIASGGQGADEPMSEAQCIYDNLIALGISPDRIWLEDQAASTWANLNYSLDLIEANTGIRPDTIGIVSSEYHMFRAKLLARDCGLDPVGIPAATSRFSQKVNHFMREIAGVWHYIVFGGQYD